MERALSGSGCRRIGMQVAVDDSREEDELGGCDVKSRQ